MGAGRHEARRHKGIRAPDSKNANKKGDKEKKRKKYDPRLSLGFPNYVDRVDSKNRNR